MRKCFGRTADVENKELMRVRFEFAVLLVVAKSPLQYATQPIAERPLSTSLCDIAFDRSGELLVCTVNDTDH